MRIRSESIARIALSLLHGIRSLKPRRLHKAIALVASLTTLSAVAVLDVAGLDRNTDPCADFYQFANRRWIDSVDIPKDRPRWGAFDQLDERNMQILVAAL